MKAVKLTTLATVILLGACSHYSEDLSSLDSEMAKPVNTTYAMKAANPQDIMPAAGGDMMAPQMAAAVPNALPQYLAREYYEMAKFENDKAYDYKASKIFTQKALMASKGKTVEPSKISSFDLSSERAMELTTARNELTSALAEQNTPDNAQSLAKAQSRFECWIERAEEAENNDHYASCKSEFEAAMATLMMPAAGTPNMFDVTFNPNTTQFDAASTATIETLTEFLNNPAHEGYSAQLMGVVSQTQGEFGTNLASARVKALQDALVTKGISATKLKGGLSPAVTADVSGKVQVMLVEPQMQTTTPEAAVYPANSAVPVASPVPSANTEPSPLGFLGAGTPAKTN